MTITPMAPMPAVLVDKALPATTGDGGAEARTFGALIAAQLDQLAEPAPGAPTVTTTESPRAEDAGVAPEPAAPATTLPIDPAQVVAAPALAVAAVAAGPVPAPTPSPLVTDAPAEGDTHAAATGEPATTRGRAARAPGHTGTLPEQSAPAAQAHAQPGGKPVDPIEPTAVPAVPDALVPTGATEPTADADLPADAPTAATPAAPTTPTAPTPPPAPTPQVVPVVGVTAPVVTPAAPVVASAPANPVLEQVAPVFSRMVSGPEGQHRMTLRLHPADLGEIHLTVTVRGESVDVTVSARPEAREMLADGSHQLKALLDAVGRTADRIVFRDLPGTGTTVQVVSTNTGSTHDGQSAAQSQAGYGESGRSGDQGRGALGRDHAAGVRQDTAASERRTATTTSPTRTASGLLRGGLDVRI